MNYWYPTSYNTNSYYIAGDAVELPSLLDVIYNNADYASYRNFRFYSKSPEEIQLMLAAYRASYKYNKSIIDESVLWLVDSPRMTHLILNEMVEAEMRGYRNIVILGMKNVDSNFFKIKDVSGIIKRIKDLIKKHNVKAVITPCINKIHNRILSEIDIKKIGIQHGTGTWVEKNLLNEVNTHFNYGKISNKEFNNPKSIIAGYSPTKLFELYPKADENYILYATQGRTFTNKKNIIEQLGMLRLQDDFGIPIVIKEHIDATGEFAGTVERVYNESGNINTIELVRKASVVITSWSGTGLESMFFDKPTIILDTQNDGGKFYKASGLVIPMSYEVLKARTYFFLSGNRVDISAYKKRINFEGGKLASKIIIDAVK